MEKYHKETGVAAPLARPNVDTDQILPKQFLKRVERTGFGEFVFTIGDLSRTKRRTKCLFSTSRITKARTF